mmetsp:Transcript_34081/g.101251  ORF Transcript_34081/g.101251 Transcript_34081/m.101251 type:complete len:100 (-) Transcript_34081:173-472(-)
MDIWTWATDPFLLVPRGTDSCSMATARLSSLSAAGAEQHNSSARALFRLGPPSPSSVAAGLIACLAPLPLDRLALCRSSSVQAVGILSQSLLFATLTCR